MQPQFDSWDLTPVSIPPRSRLHSIPPIGIGTPFVESLTGYMIRLATAHAVRVSDLIEHELRARVPYFHAPAGILGSVNGIAESAQNWVSAVERSTLRGNLRLLTMLPFASLLTTSHLMRQERAWCPQCYESRAEQGQEVYEQLIWCLQCVEICPLHNTRLVTSCHACHRQLRPICAVSRPGFCSRCHQWLGTSRHSTEDMSPTEYQAWVAREFGQLLALGPQSQPTGRKNLQAFVARYVDSFFEGNVMAAAEAAGCGRVSFHNWYTGNTTPRIDLLLRLCYELSIPLTSLVTGDTTEAKDGAFGRRAAGAKRQRNTAPQRTADQIRRALLLAVNEQPAPSIREVAKRLGYSTPTRLYVADSNLSKTIVRNFNKSGRNHWWRRRGAKSPSESAIRRALEASFALAVPEPIHHTAASLGYDTECPLTARFPELCRAIKLKRVRAAAARRTALVDVLGSALAEDPPPSLAQITRRLGYARGTMRDAEPELCGKLVARRRRFVERSREALRQRLEATLKEDPPPSLREVHARLGITHNVLYENFPEIHRAIVGRHQGFRRQVRSSNVRAVGNRNPR
jgi:transcriptional regulator with XRE-family HTH domain